MRRLLGRPHPRDPVPAGLQLEAERGRLLVEESPELVLVVDEHERVVAASRRARGAVEGLDIGSPLPEELHDVEGRRTAFRIPYEVEGRRETLLYLRDPGDLAAYEELRAGFTAAVSHELRTPLARLLALLESALLPDTDPEQLVRQAQTEVAQIRELIDDVLFLSELESGREVVALAPTRALPILAETAQSLAEAAARAGVTVHVEGDEAAELPLRPRMLRMVTANLVENAIRYAGPNATVTLAVEHDEGSLALVAADDGVGVDEAHLPRLFERFYRADRARSSRGTGLGLAIVKHVVTSAGGTVEASGARGSGLTIRCVFPGG